MIFIVVKFPVKAEHAENWPDLVADYTAKTRAEAGNRFFEWSRSLEDKNTYVLVEGFDGQDAAVAHVGSDHFKWAVENLGAYISDNPRIINVQDASDWGPMAEISPH
ncbi:putative quinol monooxygenase [Amycolatopsis sp. NPDC024027]|uniref:putative quinol monooxygenase n=1 Tax=Amycolatopsis sp. NPDC024027 TaxID=3154327 RepID=UPI00340265EA